MLKKITGLLLLGTFSLSAQLKTTSFSNQSRLFLESQSAAEAVNRNYFLESYSINLNPITFLKGYLPLTIDLRLTEQISVETGPALVTRPYFNILFETPAAIERNFITTGANSQIFVDGEADYNLNLGWETAIKFYFDRDIWESRYFALFHSYRRSSADLINIDNNSPNIEGFSFYTRNHFGMRYGSRRFLNEAISAAGDNWVLDSYIGMSYAAISSQNFSSLSDDTDFGFLGSIFIHYGISIGYLKE